MIVPKLKSLRLKEKSWDAVRLRLCVASDRGIREAVRKPGMAQRLSATTRREICRAYDELFPFPLPRAMFLARQEIEKLKERPGSKELMERIEEVEGLLTHYVRPDVWHAAGRRYLLGYCAISRAAHGGKHANWFGPPKLAWKEAETHFFEGRAAIAQAGSAGSAEVSSAQLMRLDLVLTLNWTAAIVEQVDHHRSRAEVEGFLRESSAIDAYRRFLAADPYIWQAAWNGLQIASMLKTDDATLLHFYNALKNNDPGFQSFDYAPPEVGSIAAEAELAYFRSKFTHLHTPLPRD